MYGYSAIHISYRELEKPTRVYRMDEGTMRTVCAGRHDGQILSFPCRLLITYTYAIIIRVYLT